MQQNFNNSGSVVYANHIEGNVSTETNFIYLTTASTDIDLMCFPRPDINFVGRSHELKCLKTGTSKPPHMIVVSGLGGVGKTQLVRKFIDENKSSYKNVIWMKAHERAAIEENFKTLAKESLNISIECEGKQRNFNVIVREVFNKLCKAATLIVLDNVDNKDDIKFVITMGTLGTIPHVIITSRINEWNVRIDLIKLGVFDTKDALEYVTKTLIDRENENIDSIEEKTLLVEKLQRFPLALRQATAYIINQRVERPFSIVDYIDEYNTQPVLDSILFQDESNEYAETTFTTWRVTLVAIEKCGAIGDIALRILRIIAFYDPDHIRREIFFNLELPCIDIEKEVRSAVRLLVNYSMVDSQKHQSLLSIHRLVQLVTRIELENVSGMMKTVLREGLRLIWQIKESQNFIEVHEHGAPIYLSALKFLELVQEFSSFPNAVLESFIASAKFYQAINFGNGVEHSLTTALGKENSIAIYFKHRHGYLHSEIGKISDALRMYQEVYEQLKHVSGEDNLDTLTVKSDIAGTYGNMGKHTEALRMHQEVYERMKEIAGDDHPDTITAKSEIARSYNDIGKHVEALQMHKDVYQQRREILGDDHEETLTSKFDIARTYSEIGKHSEALRIYQEVYEQSKKILGDDHPETLESKSNIARSYDEIGKYTEALRMHQEVYEQRKSALGDDHPDTLTSKFYIASSYDHIGKFSEALRIHQEVYEQMKNVSGDDHPDTLSSKHSIACSFSNIGKHSEALRIHQEVYEQRRIILGDDNPATLRSKNDIAGSYGNIGKYSEALRIHQEEYERSKNILGDDHPDTLTSRRNIASSYSDIGQHSEALLIHQEVYERSKNILGDDHPGTLTSKSSIAITYGEIGRNSDALRMHQEVYEQRKSILGDDHPDTLTSKSDIARSYSSIGKYSEALRMHQEAYEQKKTLFGDDHLGTISSKSDIATYYSGIGNYSEALLMHQEIYGQLKNLCGHDHPDTLTAKHNIACVYSDSGNYSDAIRIFQEVYDEKKNILGVDDADTIWSKNKLAEVKRKMHGVYGNPAVIMANKIRKKIDKNRKRSLTPQWKVAIEKRKKIRGEKIDENDRTKCTNREIN